MNSSEKDIKWQLSFGIGAIIGALFFIVIYGFKVLDVTNDDFLMGYHLDMTQHYLGWRLFRESAWHFPFGLCDTSIYPYMSSVVYTDSIPLFAVFFKALSPILPTKFQYFGLFGMICFMLQGGVAKLLLRKKIKNEILRNVGSLFFVSGIVFVHRMFWQTALSAHFLILLSFLLYIYRNDIEKTTIKVLLWMGLGSLAISIHFYLYGMVSVLLVGFALLEAMDQHYNIIKDIIRFLSFIVPYLAITVFLFYLYGGFYGTVKSIEMYDNPVGADVNALFESMGTSLFFSKSSNIKFETFCYIGVAVLVLLVPAAFSLIKCIREKWNTHKKTIVLVAVFVLLFVLFSLSPNIMINDKVILSVNIVPQTLWTYTWGLFRNCGRFMWPVMYLLIYVAIVYSKDILKTKYPVVLVLMLCIQLVEFGAFYYKKNRSINSIEYRVCPADVFYSYDLSNIKHIQFMQYYTGFDFYSSEDCFYQMVGYTRLAMDKNMTISNFIFSRNYDSVVQEQIDESYEELYRGEPKQDTLYVFPKSLYDTYNLYGSFNNVTEIVTDWDVVLVRTDGK